MGQFFFLGFVAIVLSLHPATAPAQPTVTWDARTFRPGNSWTYDVVMEEEDNGNPQQETDVETLTIIGREMVGGTGTMLLILSEDAGGDEMHYNWVMGETYLREVRRAEAGSYEDPGTWTYNSDTGKPGIALMPLEVDDSGGIQLSLMDEGDGEFTSPEETVPFTVTTSVFWVGRETINTPAGSFDCFSFEVHRIHAANNRSVEDSHTWWWKTGVGMIKMVLSSEEHQDGERVFRETTTMTLKSISTARDKVIAQLLDIRREAIDTNGDEIIDAADLVEPEGPPGPAPL